MKLTIFAHYVGFSMRGQPSGVTVALSDSRSTGPIVAARRQRPATGRRADHARPSYCLGVPAGASAALGRGAGLSAFEFRNAMMSARSVPRATGASPIVVPGTKPRGLARNALISSTDQLPPLAF